MYRERERETDRESVEMDECDRRTCIEREEREETERVYKWMSVTGGHV